MAKRVHDTTVTPIREYKEGDLPGGADMLPPLMLGDLQIGIQYELCRDDRQQSRPEPYGSMRRSLSSRRRHPTAVQLP